MREIGLVPSSTGAPGGKATGQRVSHYIVPGRFNEAVEMWVADHGHGHLYVDLWEPRRPRPSGRRRPPARPATHAPAARRTPGPSRMRGDPSRSRRAKVLRLVAALGGACERVLLVACEPLMLTVPFIPAS